MKTVFGIPESAFRFLEITDSKALETAAMRGRVVVVNRTTLAEITDSRIVPVGLVLWRHPIVEGFLGKIGNAWLVTDGYLAPKARFDAGLKSGIGMVGYTLEISNELTDAIDFGRAHNATSY